LHEYGLITVQQKPTATFDGIVLGVSHKEFLSMNFDSFRNKNSILYDVKGVLGSKADGKL
jgi:UDP-N-acetyl-D-galactosamine dehydrogenase